MSDRDGGPKNGTGADRTRVELGLRKPGWGRYRGTVGPGQTDRGGTDAGEWYREFETEYRGGTETERRRDRDRVEH